MARKWRPGNFSELVGQEHVVKVLANGLAKGRIHHAFLFTGTRGVGKTTIARILAKSLNCEQGVSSTPCGECANCVAIDEGRFVDLLEIDAASRTKVDDTREILDNVQYAPTRGRFKVYLIDEVHMLSRHSFNALLKTLEEPPEHVKFLLATTDPEKIPVTILSRCLQFNLRRLSVAQISGQMRHILEAEELEHDDDALELLARAADGSMRDGLSLLDQALAGAGRLNLEDVREMLGSVEQRHVHAILEALADSDAAAAIDAVGEVFSQARGMDQLLADLAEALHRLALVQQLPDYRDDSRADWDELIGLAGKLDAEDLQLWYQIAIAGRRDLPLAPSERSGCEMTILRMFAFQPASAGGAEKQKQPRAASQQHGAVAPRSEQATGAAAAVDGRQASDSRPQAAGRPALSMDNWPEVLARLPLSESFRSIAASLAIGSVDGNRVEFKIERDDMVFTSQRFWNELQEALGTWFGQPARVVHKAVDSLERPTPAVLEQQQQDKSRADAEKAIDEDPFVRQLSEQFDAEIVRESIRPNNTRSH